ncbi:unnamed protein product, partial [Arabidopsis lyrata]
MAAGALSIKI